MTRVFKAAPHAGFSDSQAVAYGRFLEREGGLGRRPVSAERIVELARPETSPLHDRFEWDDRRAAEEHRLEQARHLVRHLLVVQSDETRPPARAFHHVSTAGGVDGYIAARIVWRNPELAEQVVERALRELAGWTDRYRSYSELAAAVRGVDEILGNGRAEEAA